MRSRRRKFYTSLVLKPKALKAEKILAQVMDSIQYTNKYHIVKIFVTIL